MIYVYGVPKPHDIWLKVLRNRAVIEQEPI